MCGIFGVFRKISSSSNSSDKIVELVKALMVNSETRGRDSSGLVLVDQPYEDTSYGYSGGWSTPAKKEDCGIVRIHKAPVPGSKYVTLPEVESLLKMIGDHTSAIIGHTRAATCGPASRNVNNHPHRSGKIIGVHNGMISNWRELATKFGIRLNSQCDSEIIFALIDKFLGDKMTMQEAIQETHKHLKGWYACLVVNTSNLSQFIAFRCGAPMALRIKTYGPGFMAVASEERIIHNSYTKVFTEKAQNVHFLDLGEVILPDKHGYVVSYYEDKTYTALDDNLKKTTPFPLDK